MKKKLLFSMGFVLVLVLTLSVTVFAVTSSKTKTKNVGGYLATAYGKRTDTSVTSKSSFPIYTDLYAEVWGVQRSDQDQRAPIPRKYTSGFERSVSVTQTCYWLPYEVHCEHIIAHASDLWEVTCLYQLSNWY